MTCEIISLAEHRATRGLPEKPSLLRQVVRHRREGWCGVVIKEDRGVSVCVRLHEEDSAEMDCIVLASEVEIVESQGRVS